MRELSARIKFTSPCLGNVKTRRTFFVDGKRKKRTIFFLPRNPDGQVIFLPTWWSANMRKASGVLCRFQQDVRDIKFSMEVDGRPRRLPNEVYKRYYEKRRFSPHEAFFSDDVIGVSCLVPDRIDDDSFWQLMELAGRYYGISPYMPGKYGFFRMESLTRRRLPPVMQQPDETMLVRQQ